MRLQLKLPVEDYDALQEKLDSNKRPSVTLERRIFTLLMQDYEQLFDACQRAGIDVVVQKQDDLAPKSLVGTSVSGELVEG